jgi:P27 family predicted phage terminase small subunit
MPKGRKPIPTAIKILRQTRADRVNYLEPERIKGRPDTPEDLDGAALDEWNRLIPLIEAMGILSKGDGEALAAYCRAFAEAREAEAILKREGLIVTGSTGSLKAHPASTIAREARAQCVRVLCEFGLTPSSRSRTTTVKHTEKHSLDSFLAEKA